MIKMSRSILGLSLFAIQSLFKIKETKSVFNFLVDSNVKISIKEKMDIIKKLYEVSYDIDCPHTNEEIISFIKTVLSLPVQLNGCVVEAGCYKGGSTSKFSLAVKLIKRELIVFDSFQGIPEHSEAHSCNIYGQPVSFEKGEYCGSIEEVKKNVEKYGDISVCTFIEGWFKDTLPHFEKPVVAMYVDVDLASSIKICLKYLYPLLVEGGSFYCQDGHLPLVNQVLDDDSFWINEVGCPKPYIGGLGKEKLIKCVKPPFHSSNTPQYSSLHINA